MGFPPSWKESSKIFSSVKMEDPLASEALTFFPIGCASTLSLFVVLGDMNEWKLPESMRKVKDLPS